MMRTIPSHFFICDMCNRNRHGGNGLNLSRMPLFAKETGYINDDKAQVRKAIRLHDDSEWHRVLQQRKEDQRKNVIGERFRTARQRELQALSDLELSTARTILTSVAESFEQHPTLMTLVEYYGITDIQHHRNVRSPAIFIKYVSNDMQETLVKHLESTELLVPMSIIVDTSTDRIGQDYLVVLVQSLENDKPVVYFFGIYIMGVDVSSKGYKEVILNAFKPHEKLYEFMRQGKLVALTSDGASVFSGKKDGAVVQLSHELFGNKEQLYRTHCLAHKLNLAARKMVSMIPELEVLETQIKSMANFVNNQNSKNIALMADLAKILQDRVYRITIPFTERWSESEFYVLNNLRRSIPIYRLGYENIISSTEFSAEARSKAEGLRKIVTNRKFILLVSHFQDIMGELKHYSKMFQYEGGLLIGKEKHRNKLLTVLESRKQGDGRHLKQLLSELKCMKTPLSSSYTDCRSAEDVETSHMVRWTPTSNGKWKGPIQQLEFYLEELGNTRGSNAPKPFTDLRNRISDNLIAQVRAYFPEGDLADFEVFHPESFDLPRVLDRSFGTEEVQRLAVRFRLSGETVVSQWQNLVYQLASRNDYEELIKLQPYVLWPKVLGETTLTGMGRELRKLVRTLLVIPASSADAERAFSYMNLIKSQRRTAMSSSTLDHLMRVTINAPADITKFSTARLAKQWQGIHTSQVTKKLGRPPKRRGGAATEPRRQIFVADATVTEAEEAQMERELGLELEIDADDSVVWLADQDEVGEREGLFPPEIFN